MYLTGFADEASFGIDNQIKATKELGWQYIESRSIDGKNIHDLSDAEFDVVCEKLVASGIKINCFGSAIANWGKKINEPFDTSLNEARRAIPRMQRLGTKLIRIMSFAVLENTPPEDQMVDERVRRVSQLYRMFTDAGITPVHENCMNYGGMGWRYTLDLVEKIPGLKLVFDTGNPVCTNDYAKGKPYKRQSSWDFYSHVKEHIAYVHIKDAIHDAAENKAKFTFPGEGSGDVKRIVKDLLDNGYDGGFSMEPHLSIVFHDSSVKSEEEIKYANYIEYGRRFMRLLDSLGHPAK